MPRTTASLPNTKRRAFTLALALGFFLAVAAVPLLAAEGFDDQTRDPGPSPPPPSLEQMQSWIKVKDEEEEAEEDAKGKDPAKIGRFIRLDALKEAAISYGARGGLAWRTFQIQRRLAENEGNVSKIFNFTHLLIAAPSGLLIEPPVVSEAQKAVIVAGGGQTAAVADRVYRINRNARIVTSARNWRIYLERDWGKVDPAPKALQPRDEEEARTWKAYMKRGWDEGVRQADDIFQADLDKLSADYLGMTRYRELLAQGMITPPYATQEDRGITGGGSEMRVGDRGLSITGPPQLNPESSRWITAPR